MVSSSVAEGLSGLVGLGIVFVGMWFLLSPRTAAAGYGVALPEETGPARAYLAVKGVRDVTSGLFVFAMLGIRAIHPLGWLMLVACLIPIGDAVIVVAFHGPRARAYGVHGVTAAAMLATAVLLLVSST